MRLGRLIRTLRWLKREQLFYQVLNRLRKRLENPASLERRRPSADQWRLGEQVIVPDVWPPVPPQSLSELAQRKFRFLNDTHTLDPALAWQPIGLPRLWTYNLHYFDWLWSCVDHGDAGWQVARDLTTNWIATHLPRSCATGWEPYPSSLRIMNWSLLFGGRWREQLRNDHAFRELLTTSIWSQSCWLAAHLEYHLLANHLLENAAALVVVGRCFDGEDALRFRQRGNSIAARQLREQILDDGMHFERSAMYHARMCWLVAVLQVYGDANVAAMAGQLLPRMLDAMAKVTHPDGQIALLNDAAIGVYVQPPIRETACGSWSLANAGYFGWRSSQNDYLIVDCGEVGPTYQPGHAHADTLSFEWSLAGQRFITDTGTFEYSVGSQRNYDRSTLAHNTLSINGQDSSEVWGGFRVGYRCVPKVESQCQSDHEFRLTGSYSTRNNWQHRRTFVCRTGLLTIEDQVTGKGTANIEGRFHFAPDVNVELQDDSNAVLRQRDRKIWLRCDGDGARMRILETRYSPEFGINQPRWSIAINCESMGQTSWRSQFCVDG